MLMHYAEITPRLTSFHLMITFFINNALFFADPKQLENPFAIKGVKKI